MSTKKDPLSEIAAPGGGLSFGCADGVFAFTFAIYSICHSPQKSSTVQKVYKPDREPLLDSTSPSRLTPCHLPYRGEALAVPAK